MAAMSADLRNVTVPALILHGNADGTVPFGGSGRRTHAALPRNS
jgi:non-heme chloroperoxidase